MYQHTSQESNGSPWIVLALIGAAALVWLLWSARPEPTQSDPAATKVLAPYTYVDGVGYVPTEQVVSARATSDAKPRGVDCSTVRDPDRRAECYEFRGSAGTDYDDNRDYPDDPEDLDENFYRGR